MQAMKRGFFLKKWSTIVIFGHNRYSFKHRSLEKHSALKRDLFSLYDVGLKCSFLVTSILSGLI